MSGGVILKARTQTVNLVGPFGVWGSCPHPSALPQRNFNWLKDILVKCGILKVTVCVFALRAKIHEGADLLGRLPRSIG